jgi:hypothetical protein
MWRAITLSGTNSKQGLLVGTVFQWARIKDGNKLDKNQDDCQQ